MYVRIGARRLFLFLLVTAVVNADRFKETTLAHNINVVCVALYESFGNVSCEQGFIISVNNAYYGYYHPNRDASESCSIQPNDCLVPVPIYSTNYYGRILVGCNEKTRCDSNLEAERYVGWTSCDGLKANDYVSLEFYCLPSDVTSSPTLVPRSTTPWPTSTTSGTVPVTSLTHSSSSLSASSTTGGATIASDASTYSMIDSLGNETTTVTDNTPSTDDTTSIIVGSVVGGIVLIIVLLLLIFVVWRRRNSEDTSKRRGNNSDKSVNGLSPNGLTTMVKCDTPQGMTHSDKEYDATPSLSDNNSIPTYSLGNHSAIALYELAQDQPHQPVYWLAQEPSIAANSLARERLADCYSEVEDIAQENAYLSLYSNSTGFYKEIDKSNAGNYVNVTEPSNAAYSLLQKTISSTHQKVEDPAGSESTPANKFKLPVNKFKLPVNKFKFTNKVRIDKEEEKVSALTRHQSVERPQEDDLVLRDNSLYVATETHSPNDAVDELTLTENDLYV